MPTENPTPYQRWRAGLEASIVESDLSAEEERLIDVWMETAWEGARSAYAQAARVVGCICRQLRAGQVSEKKWPPPYEFTFGGTINDSDQVVAHDPRCPQAIAAEIETDGEEDCDGR